MEHRLARWFGVRHHFTPFWVRGSGGGRSAVYGKGKPCPARRNGLVAIRALWAASAGRWFEPGPIQGGHSTREGAEPDFVIVPHYPSRPMLLCRPTAIELPVYGPRIVQSEVGPGSIWHLAVAQQLRDLRWPTTPVTDNEMKS